MKKAIIVLGCLAVVLAGLFAFGNTTVKRTLVGGSVGMPYITATMATSSVGIYAWTNVLSADSRRVYASLCNNSITSNDAMYLAFTSTSTGLSTSNKPIGYRLPSGSCYEMKGDNMYYGKVFATASSATATLLNLVGSY